MYRLEKPARKYINKLWTYTQEKSFHMEKSCFEEETLFIFQHRRSVLLENK